MMTNNLILTSAKTSEGLSVVNLSTVRRWEQALATVVCSNMRCKVTVSNIERRSYIEVRGFDSELKVAIDTFTELLKFCRAAILNEKSKAKRFDGKIVGVENAYAASFVRAVSDAMGNSTRTYQPPRLMQSLFRHNHNESPANIQAAMLAGYSDGYSYATQLSA